MIKIWLTFSFLSMVLNIFKRDFQSESNAIPLTINQKNDITVSININVKYPDGDIYIGPGKNFYLDTEFNDTETNYFDASDIEEKTSYITYISISQHPFYDSYQTTCRLWKPKNDKLKLLCKITDNYFYGTGNYKLDNEKINYNSISININSSAQTLKMFYQNIQIPFLYADEQIIRIEEGQKYIELKLKFQEYNNESLYLYSNDAYLYLNKCSKNNKNLICEIEKEDIEGILYYKNQKFDIYYLDYGRDFKRREIIYNITIIDEILEKQDIYVRITRLLQEYINFNNFIAYETNVKFISNLVSGRFPIQKNSEILTCFFKKDKDVPMLFLCNWKYNNNDNILGNITNEIIISNCSIKYNFIIQPIKNNENFKALQNGYSAFYSHSSLKELDFRLYEKFSITYILKKHEQSEAPSNLKLFPDLEYLDCSISSSIQTCNVNRSYFENKKSGYYYTYHLINYYDHDIYSIYYEFSPIKVIIPNDNSIYIKIKKQENNIVIGKKGTLFLKTSYNDNDNIFNDTDIEDIRFTAKINDINGTYYSIVCELWKSANNFINLICHLNQSLIYKKQEIILKEAKFTYKEYTIIIYSNEYTFVEQLNYTIPLLYSDNQTIVIKEENNEYNLIFQIGEYNNEDLFLFGTINNFLKLDDCDINKRKMTCKIEKEKLEEILSLNGELFKVISINDEIGTIYSDFVGKIIVNYDLFNKEDIYVGISKILNNETELGIPIAFETNITSISNLNSYRFDDIDGYCYFKKTKIKPLLLLCVYQIGYSSIKKSLENEIIYDNIHYKFNFRIQPYSINTNISVLENGSSIYSSDKEELNFISQNINNIKLIVENSFFINNLALLYSDSKSSSNKKNINCLNLKGIIKCEISIFYFIKQNYKENNYVKVYHSYQNPSLKIDYGIAPIQVKLPEKIIDISIDIKENYDKKLICENSRIYLLTNYNSDDIFNSSTIEEQTLFKTTFTTSEKYNPNIYNLTCRLWKPKDTNLIIICESDTDLISDKQSEFQGYFNETTFYYNDFIVIITPDILLSFKIKNQTCPFLYAEKQLINLKENDEFYELNFKIDIYNNESLFLSNMEKNYINLECLEKNKNLVCKLEKENLLEQDIEETFKVYYHNEKYGLSILDLILGVVINSNIQKEDIYVNILSLLQKNIDYNNYAPYETNVTNISNLITKNFEIMTEETFNCFFKKSELNNLLILCNIKEMIDFSLGKIEQKIILNDIHIKYNFIILPVENSEIVSIDDIGSKALFLYPKIFDFYLNESYTFYIFMSYPENTNNIMFNSFSLDCTTSTSLSMPRFKKCIVDLKYFENYYGTQNFYIQHTNKEYPLIFYELSPILAKLPQSNDIIIRINKEKNNKLLKIGKNGVLFIVTDYNDSKNFLNIEDIDKTTFNSIIMDENENKYDVFCRLWKISELNSTIRLICNLNEDLKYSYQKIKLNDTMFDYKDFHIRIYSYTYIEVNQINYNLSFLYSDRQYITINTSDYKDYTNFTFKIGSYNKDILFIKSLNDNYIILDNCFEDINNTLICKILTSKLEEIIIDNIEYLSVGALNDNLGLYTFSNILPIEINSFCEQKIDVEISSIENLTYNGAMGIPFGVLTNVNDIPNLTTKKFNKYCYFKKVTGSRLYWLCNIDSEKTYWIHYDSYYSQLNNIHWKYNFKMIFFQNGYGIKIKGKGSEIKALNPEILDFQNYDNFTIRIIMHNPSLSKNIRLNSDSSNLECHDLNEMKICNISYDYFKEKQSGYFYPYYSNENVSFIFGSSLIYVNLSKTIIIPIEDRINPSVQYMGKDNIIYLVSTFTDKSNKFYNLIPFNLSFSNNKNDKIIDGVCKLWKPNIGYIRLICKLNESFENEEQIIYLNDKKIYYNGDIIIFYSTAKNIMVKQSNSEIAFLYSNLQEIIIDQNTDIYLLNFKKILYHNQPLILSKDKIKRLVINCNDGLEEVTCFINKKDILLILSYNNENFFISQIVDKFGILVMDCIFNITIKIDKYYQDYLSIYSLKLLTPKIDMNSFIVYDTNIKKTERFVTNFFTIERNTANDIINCQYKTNNDKLLLLCIATTPGESSMGYIKNSYINNAIIPYIFHIYDRRNNESFIVTNNEGLIIYSIYPEEINFNEQDSFVIRYETDYPEKLNGIKLNNDSSFELECVNRIRIKECYVNQTHFNKSGYYYTYYQTSFEYESISYETPLIKVILYEPEPEYEEESEIEKESEGEKEYENEHEEEKESKPIPSDRNEPKKLSNGALVGIIVGSVSGVLIIIGLIIFLVIRWKKKKPYNELSNNIELIGEISYPSS